MEPFGSEINITKPKKDRVNTGLNELDDLLNGGFPNNSTTLISGNGFR